VSQYTLTSVDPEPRIWKGEHGDFAIYTVSFEGEQGKGDGEIKQKASTQAPTVGATLDAEIVQKGGRPPELKRVWKENAPRGSNGGGFRSRDPKDTAQIVRQHSQHVAILWAATLQKEHGQLPLREGEETHEWLKRLIDWFDADVRDNAGSA
jgi:hypothetical protein